MEQYLSALREYGLTENEAKVYLAGLMLGSSTANELASKAELLRTTTYEILKRLKEKGLASEYEQDNIKFFDMISPKEVVNKLQEKAKKISEIVPALEKMKETTGKRPKVEVFSGHKGVRSLLEIQLSERKDVKILGKLDHSNKFLGTFRDEYIRRRIKNSIKAEVLCEPGRTAAEFRQEDRKNLRNTRTAKFCNELKATLLIFGDQVAVITFLKEDPVGVLMHNKNMADAFNKIFDEFWKNAE